MDLIPAPDCLTQLHEVTLRRGNIQGSHGRTTSIKRMCFGMEKIARRNRSRPADRGEHAGDERRHAGGAPATRIRRPESDRIELRDARVRVLVLRLTAAGIASGSVCTGTRDGRPTRPTLGTWPAVVASDARKLAQATISAMQAGGDSVTASRHERAARVEHAGPAVNDRLARRGAATPAHWQETDSRDVAGFCRREIERTSACAYSVQQCAGTDLSLPRRSARNPLRRPPGASQLLPALSNTETLTAWNEPLAALVRVLLLHAQGTDGIATSADIRAFANRVKAPARGGFRARK